MLDAAADPVVFAAKVLGLEAFGHEAEALRERAAWVVIAGGRRSGKTTSAAVKALHVMHARAGCQVLVTGPTEAKVKEFVAEAADLLRAAKRPAEVDAQTMRLRLPGSSSELVGVVGTAEGLRGFGRRVMLVVVEEAGFTDAAVWTALRYTILDNLANGAQVWAVGSPWGAPDHPFRTAHRRGEDGDEDYAAFTWPTTLNPRVPRDWVERERERVNSIEATAELDGRWPDVDGEQFFPRALLQENVAPLELPALGDLRGPAQPVLALDWGVNFDASAAMVAYRLPVASLNPDVEWAPRLVLLPHAFPVGMRLGEVVETVAGWRAPWWRVAPEITGVGAMPSQELRRRLGPSMLRRHGAMFHLVATTGPKKLAGYSLIRWMLERHTVVLPRDPTLLRQLAGVRMARTATGQPHLAAEDANVHDDLADAAAFAMLPIQGHGRAGCRMARWLARESAVPDVDVPLLDCPVVETGAGVRMYERPPLQSVAGTAVTLPDGVGALRDRPVPTRPPDPKWNALRARLAELQQQSATAREEQRDA